MKIRPLNWHVHSFRSRHRYGRRRFLLRPRKVSDGNLTQYWAWLEWVDVHNNKYFLIRKYPEPEEDVRLKNALAQEMLKYYIDLNSLRLSQQDTTGPLAKKAVRKNATPVDPEYKEEN